MNVQTIAMAPDLAREKLKAYRANIHRQADQEYQQTAKGYEALAKGTPLIDISTVWPACGFDDKGRPNIAICRADRKEVEFVGRDWRGTKASFRGSNSASSLRSRSLTIEIEMPEHLLDKRITGFALVPMIPADKIPATGQRKDWHILWEVERWADRSMAGRAPVDPFLLKHIGGTLYAVLAEWDLTPLEQAIMQGALRS